MKRLILLSVLALGVGGLFASGVTTSGATTAKPVVAAHASKTNAAHAGKFLACMVTDTGGIDDRSFNASSWQGVKEAESANIRASTCSPLARATTSPTSTPSSPRSAGSSSPSASSWETTPSRPPRRIRLSTFAIVDYTYSPAIKNIDALVFDTVQDGFLGGYLAAGYSKTHVVATFGGIQLPTVTIYMDGFWDGVQYYNKMHPSAPNDHRSSVGTSRPRRAPSRVTSPTRPRARS